MMQTLITALIVAASAGYAAWVLMPAAWRVAIARRVLRREPAQDAGSACGGCGGCSPGPGVGAGPKPGEGHTATVQVYRRPDR